MEELEKRESLFPFLESLAKEHGGIRLENTEKEGVFYPKWKERALKQYEADARMMAQEGADEAFLSQRFRAAVSDDGMEACLFLFPPLPGQVFTYEQARDFLEDRHIVYGILEWLVRKAVQDQNYLRLIPIAKGKPAKDGANGKIIDHFSRTKEIHLTEDKNGEVDYRNLNWLQKVEEGGVICEIIPPEKQTPGMDVYGREVRGRDGKAPFIPIGKNTAVDEEKGALVALCDGQVSFRAGSFQVDQLLNVNGDVDQSVGNLDVAGDLRVNGNVLSGFTVRATGNIVVRGLVEGAFLHAGKDIQIGLGMKGNSKGKLEAKGDIRCKFLESTIVKAGGCFYSDSVVNSDVTAGDSVYVLHGKGIIVGSTVRAANHIEALTIGNKAGSQVVLDVGNEPERYEKIANLEGERKELDTAVHEREADIALLEKAQLKGALDEDYQKILTDLRLKQSVERMKLKQTEKKISKLKKEEGTADGQILCNILYPPADVSVKSLKMKVDREINSSRIYLKQGEISIGAK